MIGIVAQPFGGRQQYIAASYVKFVEAGGGRPLPLSYYASNETTMWWLSRINGVLLPGGGAAVPDAARVAVEYGEIPVWGTCLGFEWIQEILGAELATFDAQNLSLPLAIREQGFLLRSPSMRQILQEQNVTMNNHNYGVTVQESKLRILSTSFDRNGKEFVSTAEGGHLYGVQWHPEKNAFEHGERLDGMPYEAIDHSSDAVSVTSSFASSLVDLARLNNHTFEDPTTRQKSLFVNFPASTLLYPSFEQAYFFSQEWRGTCPPH